MKIKGRTDDGSMRQLNDWLAELRQDRRTEPHAEPAVRAVIGNQLRMPVMWCEMSSCIACLTHH